MNEAIACDHETDFAIWIDAQIALLREKKFEQLDLDNLIDELDSMGISQKRELLHRLETLIMHLLKCQYQSKRISNNWLGTVYEQRRRIDSLLDVSPSLARLLSDDIAKAYPHAVSRAATEARLSHSAFPVSCPYSVEQLLDMDYFPPSVGPSVP